MIPDGYNTIPSFLQLEGIAASLGINYTDFYVDLNAGDDDADGLTWETAFASISVAAAAAHAEIAAHAAGWAGRCRVYCKGDQVADADGENLVLWAQKTDFIGVGSTNWFSKPTLVGNHVIPNTHEGHGCRWINFRFKGPAAGGDIFTFTDQHGIEFLDCDFFADSTTAATAAIIATACVDLKIKGCRFFGAFSDAVIELGAGQADGLRILENEINGADNGVEIPATATFSAGRYGLVKDNVIQTTKICVTDSTNKVLVHRNLGITGNAKGSGGAGAFVCSAALAQDNRFTASDANNVVFPAEGAIA